MLGLRAAASDMHALCAAWYTPFPVQGDGAQELAAVCEAPPAGSRTRGGAVHACQCVVAFSPIPQLSDTCLSLLSTSLALFSFVNTQRMQTVLYSRSSSQLAAMLHTSQAAPMLPS
jgi:hypothetical protein